MCFSANLKKYLAGLTLAGVAVWFAGCSESASTPKPSPSTSSSTAPKLNSDGSVKGTSESNGEAATSASSNSDDEEKPRLNGDAEQAGSTTGRDVPEAAPAKDE